MKYEDLSDFEINKLVATELGITFPNKPNEPYCSVRGNVIINNGCDGRDAKPYFGDYCNNPSDAWPIIVENGISIFKDNQDLDNDWRAMGDVNLYCDWEGNEAIESCSFDSCNKNPLRAAMICFLKMKGGES